MVAGICRKRAIALGVALALAALACGSHVHRGASLYESGRYIEAAEYFERTQQRLTEAGPPEKAEYGLYRGLTFLSLGDRERAREWLAYAHAALREAPQALDREDQELLKEGWSSLDRPAPPPARPPRGDHASDVRVSTRALSNGRRFVAPSEGSPPP
jgi:tetratricopeptide (TPR) repeat protein